MESALHGGGGPGATFSVVIDGIGLVNNIPGAALRPHEAGASVAPGSQVLVDLRRGKWARGVVQSMSPAVPPKPPSAAAALLSHSALPKPASRGGAIRPQDATSKLAMEALKHAQDAASPPAPGAAPGAASGAADSSANETQAIAAARLVGMVEAFKEDGAKKAPSLVSSS